MSGIIYGAKFNEVVWKITEMPFWISSGAFYNRVCRISVRNSEWYQKYGLTSNQILRLEDGCFVSERLFSSGPNKCLYAVSSSIFLLLISISFLICWDDFFSIKYIPLLSTKWKFLDDDKSFIRLFLWRNIQWYSQMRWLR